jgi:WD40 repeat protein
MNSLLRCASLACGLLLLAISVASAAPFVPARNAQCVAISPDGKLAATGISGMSNSEFPPRPHPSPSKCGVLQIWDIASGTRLRRMETYGDLTKIRFSQDGKLLASARLFATGDDVPMHEVCLWDVVMGKVVHQFHGCHGFDFSPDGESIVVLSRSRCALYDLATRKKEQIIEPLGGALSVSFFPDGKIIAGALHADNQFRVVLCDAATGQSLAESQPLDEAFYHVAVSADGKLLATGHNGGNVLLWDAVNANGTGLRPIARLKTATPGLQHPFFSPDGLTLAAASQDNGDAVFWELATGKEYRRYTFERGTFRTYYSRPADDTLRPETDPYRYEFSPDGTAFMAGCYGGIIRLVASGQEVRRFGD